MMKSLLHEQLRAAGLFMFLETESATEGISQKKAARIAPDRCYNA